MTDVKSSGFDEIMEIRKWLSDHCMWYASHWNWEPGYLVLVCVPGNNGDFNVDLDDSVYGILAFTRVSSPKEWDENLWDLQVCTKECWNNAVFDTNELERMAMLMKALSNCKEPYKKHAELTEEIVQKRIHMERLLKKYGYEPY